MSMQESSLKRLDRVASETLSALHREPISVPAQVLEILRQTSKARCILSAGINRRNEASTAMILAVDGAYLLLATSNIAPSDRPQLFFTTDLAGVRYFFACTPLSVEGIDRLRVSVPDAIYRAERRDLGRRAVAAKVSLRASDGNRIQAEVANETLQGLAILLPESIAVSLPAEITVYRETSAEPLFARVCHRSPDDARKGWIRVGLSVSSVPTNTRIAIDRRSRILNRRPSLSELVRLAANGASVAARRAGWRHMSRHVVKTVRFENNRNEPMLGIENAWGDAAGATAVVIPPAWGRTKETMLPLALTIERTFRLAQKPIRVLRFDGTNRRGESYIDPDFREPGQEYLRFTFSQAARDISSAVDYLYADPLRTPSAVVLVTFSLAAVEARRALVSDRRVGGWVSVVGMADLQTALRTISGGIDYGDGLLRGVRFGRHELVGVVADMDHTGLDAINHHIGFLEDVRRDMARIEVPITWIHGKHDAWMDLDRVVETMSCGRVDNRRLIEVPTGHQLRSSRNALATFQLIAEEVSEMALGSRISGAMPSLTKLASAREAELARLPRVDSDVREFWRDYLLGRRRILGMELLAATAAYRNFMEMQIQLLSLDDGERVADLGAGTGDFGRCLQHQPRPKKLCVVEVDYLREALSRAGQRRQGVRVSAGLRYAQCVCNLDLESGSAICLQSGAFDAVLASLVISYLKHPERFLREVFRVLKPGGRVVVSSMVKDADATMLFHDGVVEYATREARTALDPSADELFDVLVRDFLNDGSRLLEFEERGRFQFWDGEDLRFAAANAGFVKIRVCQGFGDPAQAVILSAERP